MDALRKNRTKEYIPENMLPRNPYTGKVLKPNAFDNAYISTEASMKEGQTNKIDLVQGNIPTKLPCNIYNSIRSLFTRYYESINAGYRC